MGSFAGGVWTGRALLLALGLVVGCAGEEEVDALCDREVPLTYESWGSSFLHTHCNGCHSSVINPLQRRGAPPGVNFDTYAGVLQFADRIEARVIVAPQEDAPTMPPGGGPTAEELLMLDEWLQCRVYDDKARWEGQ